MPCADAPPPYRTVVFDCDSTLSAMEGIEQLAGANHAAELARLTRAAMEGSVPLEDVFARRLETVRPTRSDVERIGRLYVERLLPHAEQLVAALLELGKRVLVVSGGLLPAVLHLARSLGLGRADVQAVDVRWDEAGNYLDFDRASPLARSGGKALVLARIGHQPGARPLAFVGDGATDLEAAPHVERFVAYGGVERRAAVFAAARVTCEVADFAALVPLLLAPGEVELLRGSASFQSLLRAAPLHPSHSA